MAGCEITQPYLSFTRILDWKERPNNLEFNQLNPHFQEPMNLHLEITIYPYPDGRIIIIYPGAGEDGRNLRYLTLAHQMQTEGLGAAVISGNPNLEPFLPHAHLKKMIRYSIDHRYLICSHKKPELLLMGFSAGAAAVASVASDYSMVTRILLIAPSGNIPKEIVESNLGRFGGEVYIVIGKDDEVVGVHAGDKYYQIASQASRRELFVVEHCNHYFSGEINDNIFKRAPFYAFAQGDKPNFP